MSNQRHSSLNPVAVVKACLYVIPGLLVLQAASVALALGYTPILSMLGGAVSGGLAYLNERNKPVTPNHFYRTITKALTTAIGCIMGGLVIGPILFSSIGMLPTSAALILGIGTGALVSNLISRLFLTAKVSGWISKVYLSDSPSGIMIASSWLIGMTLVGCFGLPWGPEAWIKCIFIGSALGLSLGWINSKFNYKSDAAKVISSFYAISGSLMGVMLGAIVGSLVPIVSVAFFSVFFGISLMLGGLHLGNTIGNCYQQFDLDNAPLRHKIYIAALLLPVIFLGYLSGGVLGFFLLPGNSILLSQAIGLVTSGSLYGLLLSSCYLLRDVVSLFRVAATSNNPATCEHPPTAVMSTPPTDLARAEVADCRTVHANVRMLHESFAPQIDQVNYIEYLYRSASPSRV